MNDLDYDIIIVGGGLAGASLACALGGRDVRVAIIEAQPWQEQWPEQTMAVDGFDARVSALTVASQQFLQQLDVWPALASQRLSPYRSMHVWDADGTGFVDFSAREVNEPVLGHIVENRLTLTALVRRMRQLPNIHCLNPEKVAQFLQGEGRHVLRLEGGREISAAIIVAADGGNSRIRQQANFSMREWDYGHEALVTTVQTSEVHQQTAWQRFMPEGPLAFLPLAGDTEHEHFCSIVWSTLPHETERLMALDDKTFAKQLGRAFEYRLGSIEAISRRFSFPLRQRHAVDYIKPGVVLVGDAAHTIHPLAGQGINLGLKDVQVLAEEILRADDRGLAFSDFSILQRYQRRRKSDNLMMMAAMEGFKHLFEHPTLPVRWLRNTGMHLFNNTTTMKQRIMRGAMGL